MIFYFHGFDIIKSAIQYTGKENFVLKPSKRCVIIVNPTSGREKAPRYIPYMTSVLSEKYEDVTIKLTQKAGDAKNFARYAAEKNKDIFCMGGDGTINEVINGMVSVQSESSFGFVPFGTVNDLSQALRMPRSPKKVIDMFRRAEKKFLDVGKINDRYFINIVAAGLLPEAVSQVTIKEKTLFGSLAYFMKGFQVFAKQQSYQFTITEANGTVIQVSSPLIAAMLTDSAGSFRNLIPSTKKNNGVIKLALFHDFQWLRTIREAPKLLAGMQLGPEVLTVIAIKKAHISIENDAKLCTNVDGDKGPCFPIDLEILPARLSVFVPNKDDEENILFPHLLESVPPKLKFPLGIGKQNGER